MTISRPITIALGLATGVVAGGAIYLTGGATATAATNGSAPVRAAAPSLSAPMQYAPCTAPATLENGVCITHRVVTKVLPAPPSASGSVAGAPVAGQRYGLPAPTVAPTVATGGAPGGADDHGDDDGGHGEHVSAEGQGD